MRRNTAGASKATGRKASLKFKGRFSSAASLQSALNLKRKEAFDNESHMMIDDTTDENITFVTSTTDYLRGACDDAKSRNLDASFDESDTSDSRGRDPAAGRALFSSRTQGSANAREKKRLQEREWEKDRQRKTTAEPRYASSKSKGCSQRPTNENTTFLKLDAPIVLEDYDNESDNEQTFQPRSSRQLGSTPTVKNTMARDGYDSDSYSMKAGRQKYRTGRNAPRRHHDMGESHADSQPHSNPAQSLLEDSTRFDDSMAFAASTVAGTNPDGNSASANDSFLQESAGKIKMTKMEKIKQLQAKNDRYKEEYKKTYFEKKEFKKKYEDKKMEVASLTSEIESYMRETALLKKQLHQLTSEVDQAEGSTQKDMAKVAQLQKELQETHTDLKEALGRIAERKMERVQLQEIMKRKDEQIESLTLEVSSQIEEVQKLQAQISVQDMGSCASSRGGRVKETEAELEQLKDENENMKAELSMTLTRAAEMVKNREGTIEILRKENEELKELMDIRSQDDDRSTSSERIQRKEDTITQLRTEISGLKELLDQSSEDEEDLKQIIQNREEELKNVKIDVEGLKRMVKRAEKEASKAKKENEDKDVTIATLKEEVRGLKSQGKEAARNANESHHVVESRDVEIRQLQDKIKQLKNSQDGSSEQLSDAKASLKEKEEELKAQFRENEDLKAGLLQQREKLDEKRKAVVLELETTKLREKELQDQVEETDAMVKQRDDAIEDLLKEVERLKKHRDNKESNHSQELSKHEQNVVALMKEIDQLKANLNEKEEELEYTSRMVKEREVAIEDLLRDIEGLKQDGSDLEKRVKTRTEKLNKEIKDRDNKVENLQREVEDLTNRLGEALKSLESKAESLQEREEEMEELLQDVSELKRQHQEELRETKGDKQTAKAEELKRELGIAQELIKENEEKLRRIVRENVKLKDSVDAAKAKKDGREPDKEDDESEEGDTKSYLVAQHEVLEEEIQQLNDQVNDLQEELEEVHRQNSILNEEVEDWLQRGGNFELEIQRLKNEIEGWEDRAEQMMAAAEGMCKDDGASVGGNSTGGLGDQQAMMLEKAMAERQRKAMMGSQKGVWGLFFNQSEEGEELTEDQKRIRELETIKDAQAEELQKVKSDFVRLTTSSRNESYVAKKKISDLEEENEGYKAKVELLLRRLSEVQGVPYGDDDDEKKMDDPKATSRFQINLLS